MRNFIIIFAIFFVVASLVFFLSPDLNRERIALKVDRGSNPELFRNDVAVLVLGQVGEGQGGRWHFAPDLTDAMVLAYYRVDNETLNLISLPRDLYGEFGGECFKLNEVYRRDKIEDLLIKLSDIAGIETNQYLVIDLGIIEKAVDELGGISVELTSAVTDSITGYQLDAGEHHLDGKDTVWLIRNRYAPEGDFFREKNQHVVIQSIFKKFSALNAEKRINFFLKLLPERDRIKANFNLGGLVTQFKNIDSIKFNSIILDFSTGLLESSRLDPTSTSSAYIRVPRAGMDNYEEVREYILGSIR
jgi:LCP family protein required for cell wall assembly